MTTRHLFLILHLLVLSSLLLAQNAPSSKEEVREGLKEFKDLYKAKNAHVRRAAVEGLMERRLDHADVMEELIKVLNDPEKMVRDAAIVGLSTQRSTEAVARMIQKMWRGSKKKVRLAVLEAFKKSVPPVAFTAVVDITEAKDWEIRRAATELVGHYPENQEGRCLGVVIPRLEDKEVLVRLAAVDAMSRLGNPRGNKPALTMLQDKDWRVRAAAIQAVLKFRKKSAVQPLIDIMKTEKGRLVDDAANALERLTGHDWDLRADAWQKWWDRNKTHFKIPTLRELLEAKKKAEAPTGYARPKREYPPYHGIKTRSRRMIFVLDVSGSMAGKVTLDERHPRYIEEFTQRYGDNRVKIDIAREELINMIAGLKPFVRFNIVTFSSKVKKWQKGLVSATPGTRNKAIKYLHRLTASALVPTGGRTRSSFIPSQTNTFDALNAIYNLTKEKDVAKKGFKTEADTAFLLSDGNPTAGRIQEPGQLLGYFRTINRRAKVVIHTISFGNANKNLMEPLARMTGGQFVTIGN